MTGTYNHKVDDVKQAVAKDPGKKAGITFDLTADMLTEDVELVIDGTTFTFLTDTSNTAAVTGNQIDLRDVIKAGGNSTAQLTEAINQLSQKDTTNFDITKDSNGKLHIEQKVGSTEEYDYDRLTGGEVVKAINNGDAQAAKNAGTTIAIDSNSVAFGDKITIGGKTFVFQDDATKVGADEVQVNGKTATDLMDAINNNPTLGLTAELDPNDSNTVIVRSSAAGGTAAAPLVGGTGLTLQIGDTSDSFNQMNLKIGDMHVNAMGTQDANGKLTKTIEDIDISTQAGAQEAVDVIKNAINYVSSVRGDLGAIQNRLEHTANNLSVMAENIQDAESTIRDTDVAEEMMSYVKNNILVQSAQAMLAQANQVPQGVLQLLG
ncbi:MAG: flagellin [Oscillospiraceae bacterium]|nr:flagellin [Oscillospiraceae bacterium]